MLDREEGWGRGRGIEGRRITALKGEIGEERRDIQRERRRMFVTKKMGTVKVRLRHITEGGRRGDTKRKRGRKNEGLERRNGVTREGEGNKTERGRYKEKEEKKGFYKRN